mmetsp:Transcript_11429/g.21234  ORF Transcript_11429/g.21234 Transcript_11429/m.21234 type:complete len:188 (+) Transcript_11429:604-1167(+)
MGSLRTAAALVYDPSADQESVDFREAKKLISRIKVFGSSLPGSPLHMRLERRRLLALNASGVLDAPFDFFMTYGANDVNWPELYEMIAAKRRRDEKMNPQQKEQPHDMENSLPKTERLKLLAENPLLATSHYFARERAFWKHIMNGRYSPFNGPVVEHWKRHDALQRGSWHTHSLISVLMPNDVVSA